MGTVHIWTDTRSDICTWNLILVPFFSTLITGVCVCVCVCVCMCVCVCVIYIFSPKPVWLKLWLMTQCFCLRGAIYHWWEHSGSLWSYWRGSVGGSLQTLPQQIKGNFDFTVIMTAWHVFYISSALHMLIYSCIPMFYMYWSVVLRSWGISQCCELIYLNQNFCLLGFSLLSKCRESSHRVLSQISHVKHSQTVVTFKLLRDFALLIFLSQELIRFHIKGPIL